MPHLYKVSGALQVAVIKVLLKLQQHQFDPLLVTLLEAVVRMCEIPYKIQDLSSYGYTSIRTKAHSHYFSAFLSDQ